jgi:hypothetical protein
MVQMGSGVNVLGQIVPFTPPRQRIRSIILVSLDDPAVIL